MKQVTFLLLLIVYSTTLFSQQSVQMQTSRENYLAKSKNRLKTGRILLIGGAALMATAILLPRGELVHDGFCIGFLCTDEYKNDNIKGALLLGGTLSMLGSIPFFISSRHNKKKAQGTSAYFKMEKISVLQQAGISIRSYPAASVKIYF